MVCRLQDNIGEGYTHGASATDQIINMQAHMSPVAVS